jgi:hypothetical protein
MNLDSILAEIDFEISRLQQAKQLLSNHSAVSPVAKRGPGRPPAAAKHVTVKQVKAVAAKPKRRTMSAAGRARIAAAQKARWAKVKKAAKKAAPVKAAKKAPAKSAAKKAAAKVDTAATPAS